MEAKSDLLEATINEAMEDAPSELRALAVVSLIQARFLDKVRVEDDSVTQVNDRLPGTLLIQHDNSTRAYAVSFTPADYGRGGALTRIQLTRDTLIAFLNRISVRKEAIDGALAELDAKQACQIPDLAPSRAILQEMELVD
jgi:hypothetical protein